MIDDILSGTILIKCQAKDNLTDVQLCRLETLLDSFLGAIRTGMFHPAQLIEAVMLKASINESQSYRGQSISVKSLHLGAFRILNGMFVWYHKQIATLAWYEARRFEDTQNLLLTKLTYPSKIDSLPFRVYFSELHGIAPSVLIRIHFLQPPLIELRNIYLESLKIWNNLLYGGFPPDDELPGESYVGASSTCFIAPSILEHYIEGSIVNCQCFNLILNMVSEWSKTTAVSHIEIE